MPKISTFRYADWSLKRKLFVYMLLLALILLAILAAGLIIFGRTKSTADHYTESLEVQMEVFEKDITVHFDHLAASAVTMSAEMSAILDEQLTLRQIAFADLTDSDAGIAAVQEAMIEPLRQKLLQVNCSGVFVMLDATVNSALPQAARSKTGLYLQTTGYDIANPDILMYRGRSDIARAHGIMPHRKWRLEFRTDLLPGHTADFSDLAADSLAQAWRVSDMFTLPGTSERALLLTIPVLGPDGSVWGICGFEISASYFLTYHQQPAKLPHLSCLLSQKHENILITAESLNCGGSDAYFHTMTDDYAIMRTGDVLMRFQAENFSYIGLTKPISLSPGQAEHTLSVMIPLEDYQGAIYKGIVQTLALTLLLFFFTVSFCRYFSRRFLSPLLAALEQIKSDQRDEVSSNIPEILDLIDYLSRQEQEHGEQVTALEQQNQAAEDEKRRLQAEYEQALRDVSRIETEYREAQNELQRVQAKIERLAYSRKAEIDPADYQFFLHGLQTLTETERNLFAYYLAGKSANDILVLMNIKESTLKYHNHNLLGKLGVSSRKQMLRYAEVMRQQKEAIQ